MRLGIDLGGTNIAVGLVNEHGRVIYKKSTPTLADRSAEQIINDIVNLCNVVCSECQASLNCLDSIGIAVPGGVEVATGTVVFTPNIPFSGINIADILSKKLCYNRVGVINDANAALLAEMKTGSAVNCRDIVMITIGTGIGGAIAIDGKIVNGINGMAGEIGHLVIQKNGKECSCGRRGCFETYASATALMNLTRQEIDNCRTNGEYTVMSEATELNARIAFDAYKQGDNAAKRVIHEYIDALSCGIVSLINIFQPDLFVIGGGVSGEKEFLINLINPYFITEQYSRAADKKTILTTAQCGNDAGIIGAAFA